MRCLKLLSLQSRCWYKCSLYIRNVNITDILASIIVLAALFAYMNHRFIKWPPAIGITVLSLGVSLIMLVCRGIGLHFIDQLASLVNHIDFREVLLNFMLSFLLFAGAIHLNGKQLYKERLPVTVLALFGTVISAGLVGLLTWLTFGWLGYPIPFIYCLIFGTIISPTDPVAVLSILKEARIPVSLELKISGESLFNDGIGVVLFVTMTEIARSGQFSVVNFTQLLLREAGGGLVFGALLGYAGFFLLKSVNDYIVEVLITLAIVTGGYALAGKLHISGPLAMVVAGLITGNKSRREGLSKISWDYLGKFWEMIDEIFNAVLFMLIGLEMLVLSVKPVIILVGSVAILIMLLSRWVSVAIPVWILKRKVRFERHVITILSWGGLKGGLSIALALSLSPDSYRDVFVIITYIIVLFSILIQGLSIGPLTRRLLNNKPTG